MNRYDTYTVMAMVEEVEVANSFFTSLFFPNVVNFTTRHIEFDMRRGGRRVAPFVSPLVAGVPLAREGYVTKSFSPAYLKPKSHVQPTDALVRTAGEGYFNGQMTPAQRMDMLMTQELAVHDEMITNRIEWMASKTMLEGGYLVSGEDYQDTYVDFGHPADLKVSLVLTPWSDYTPGVSHPIDDIENAAAAVRTESRGAVCDTVVFGRTAWQAFRTHPVVKDRMDRDIKRARESTIDDSTQIDPIGMNYVGTLDGKLALYVLEDYLTDDNGNDVPLMDPMTVLVASRRAFEGGQYYGAILDADADFQSVRMYSKSRTSFDPTGEELLSQSAPLVAPKRMNTWAILTTA